MTARSPAVMLGVVGVAAVVAAAAVAWMLHSHRSDARAHAVGLNTILDRAAPGRDADPATVAAAADAIHASMDELPPAGVPQPDELRRVAVELASWFAAADWDSQFRSLRDRGFHLDSGIVRQVREMYADYPPDFRPFDVERASDEEVIAWRFQERARPWARVEKKAVAVVFRPYAAAPPERSVGGGADADDLSAYAKRGMTLSVGESRFAMRPPGIDAMVNDRTLPIAHVVMGVVLDDAAHTRAIVRITLAFHPAYGWFGVSVSSRQTPGELYFPPH